MQSAAGLLLAYLIQYGASVKLNPEQALTNIATALAEPAEVTIQLYRVWDS